ncbi:alpha/beta hydrolase [Parvibaculum sp.]|uniref:alpha/beta fold hydrolase n=1 Tax=Parvibaculum sp. TaxID=2024848 RepID=UPI000C8E77E7|nr:alpha/beta hydrolase [Parvibaculum sp.]MAB13400.1 alpha/beta hydrolase [Parvibaculum sp.]
MAYDEAQSSAEAAHAAEAARKLQEEWENRGPTPPHIPDEDIIRHRPQWFKEALDAPRTEHWLEVDGAKIHYYRWGNDDPKRPGVLFVHGNGAHANWFHFIAPLISDRYNVASMDLAGMGDSEWRESYTRESFARGIGEVALAAGLGPKPVICGHSFGGFVTLIAGKHYGDKLGGLILADFTVRPKEDAHEWFTRDGNQRRPTRIYPDFESAVARFRLAPLQVCANQFIIDYIAPLSLREVKKGENPGRAPSDETGWTWKFDGPAFNGLKMGDDHAEIYAGLPCKAASFFGQYSKDYEPERLDFIRGLRPGSPVFTIAGAQHHIMLDQPHAFSAAVASLMGQWEADGALG